MTCVSVGVGIGGVCLLISSKKTGEWWAGSSGQEKKAHIKWMFHPNAPSCKSRLLHRGQPLLFPFRIWVCVGILQTLAGEGETHLQSGGSFYKVNH